MRDAKLSQAVADTTGHLPLTDQDKAAVRLAVQYAAAIDQTAALADQAAAIELDGDDVTGRRQLAALAKQVETQAVLAELGPKLLACLVELGATPKARAALKPTTAAEQSKLAEMRAKRGA